MRVSAQRKEELRGYIAEYCDRCAAPTPHTLNVYSERIYVYFVPVSPWQVFAASAQCLRCHHTRKINHRDFPHVAPDPSIPIEQLATQTNPRIATMMSVGHGSQGRGEAYALGARVGLTAREAQLVYHLEDLSTPAKRRELNWMALVLLGGVACVPGFVIMAMLATVRHTDHRYAIGYDAIDYMIGIAGAALVWFGFYLVMRVLHARSLYQAFLGHCVRAQVTRQEVRNAVAAAQRRGTWLARKISV